MKLDIQIPSIFKEQWDTLLHKHLSIAMEDIRKKLQQTARTDHKYQNRTNNLKNSTIAKTKDLGLGKGFELDLSVDLSKASYGKYIIQGDPFIENALIKEENYINSRIEQAVNNAVDEFNRS